MHINICSKSISQACLSMSRGHSLLPSLPPTHLTHTPSHLLILHYCCTLIAIPCCPPHYAVNLLLGPLLYI